MSKPSSENSGCGQSWPFGRFFKKTQNVPFFSLNSNVFFFENPFCRAKQNRIVRRLALFACHVSAESDGARAGRGVGHHSSLEESPTSSASSPCVISSSSSSSSSRPCSRSLYQKITKHCSKCRHLLYRKQSLNTLVVLSLVRRDPHT